MFKDIRRKHILYSENIQFFSASGGASIGQYGPLVHFGTTLGAWLKKTVPFNFTPDLYIGAGVAASISSGFGAPLAGLIFAHEAILRHYSHKSLLAIATASGISYAVSTGIWGDTNIIKVSSENFNLLLILVVSFLAGPIFGLIAILYMKSLLFFAKLADTPKLKVLYKYIFCILSLCIIGHFMPEVMGLGSETVSGILYSSYTLIFLVIILFGKILATSISLNFGFFGGVFSPAILVGAAAGAVVSAFLITLGIFSLLSYEIDLSIIAAFLTIVGYSLNDTIVVFDRIRENFPKYVKKTLKEVINISLNETLSRTIITSLTTLIVVAVLFIWGGEVIHLFAFALII